MRLLRNPEVKKALPWLLTISAAATVGAFIWKIYFGIFTLLLCLTFVTAYLLTTYKRYKQIAQLSESINRILHGDNTIDLGGYTEGALGVLRSELYKMTVRLREQQANLQKDKVRTVMSSNLLICSHFVVFPWMPQVHLW